VTKPIRRGEITLERIHGAGEAELSLRKRKKGFLKMTKVSFVGVEGVVGTSPGGGGRKRWEMRRFIEIALGEMMGGRNV